MKGFIKIVENGVNGTNVNFVLFHLANGSFILPIILYSLFGNRYVYILGVFVKTTFYYFLKLHFYRIMARKKGSTKKRGI